MLAFACATLLFAVSAPRLDRPPLPPEALAEEATHIVVGVVEARFSRERVSDALGKGTLEDYFAFEVHIEKAEKGEGLKAGELVYARAFEVKKAGEPNASGSSGHRPLPAPGDRVRVYLQKDKRGGFDVVYMNGFEILPKK